MYTVTSSDASSMRRHVSYTLSYSPFFECFVQCVVIGLRTTERVWRNKNSTSIGNNSVCTPRDKETPLFTPIG
jgi:hypothetical protein